MQDQTEKSSVKILTSEEKNNYDGVTIDESKPNDVDDANASSKNFFVAQFLSSSLVTKIATIILVASILAFLVFVALPMAFMFIGIAALVFILSRLYAWWKN